jgi:hypothetical protein
MKLSGFVPFVLGIVLLNSYQVMAQVRTEVQILKQAAVQQAAEENTTFKKLLQLSRDRGWKMMTTGKEGHVIMLSGIDPLGYPLYVSTDNNVISAASIKTNLLWPGGSTGLALNGSSANMKGKLGIWDGGLIRKSHVELVNRITTKDGATNTTLNDHATHVAGTMVASGVNPVVKGMSFGAQQLIAYDFTNHLSEMLAEASNLLVSNHSYGTIAGWHYNDTNTRWEFYGQVGTTEDYKFGYYSSEAQVWDSIAYNAPNYLIVKSAGNDRNENGPAVGQPYWRMDASGTFINAGNRPDGISNNNGYDNIPTYGTSKNILTVGAINPIPGGYSIASDATLSGFSSWGPTDDGRIKPDVVTDGVSVLSSISTGDNDYASYSGTSMSSPAAAGSLFLLQEYYSKLNAGAFMRSATLKGIIIHTADEGGNVGPDYQFGWGVVNMEKAAAVITANTTSKSIYENNLANGTSFPIAVVATGKGPLTVTICWTDPKGTVETASLLNNNAKKLVNDLDLRIKHGATTTYMPYVLNPAAPTALATTGDNIIDNVEKIVIDDAVPGDTYNITVSHKGTLTRGSQAYSLIISGAGGAIYCTSAPLSSAGARIDKVTVGSFSLSNPTGCTVYTNNTTSTVSIEPGQIIPVTVAVSSCDATSASKIVKIFIDYNNDGDFNDVGETVATSLALSGTATYSGTFTTPGNLTSGSYALMRVIVQQTSTASDVSPCGTYANGETQDYRVKIANPSNDIGVTEIVSPSTGSCSSAAQYVSVRIRNFGATDKVGVPVTLDVKNGVNSVASVSATCADTIHANSDVIYTFQAPFITTASTTYTITAAANLTGDQNSLNNTITSSVIVSGGTAAPTGTATVCGTSQVFLNATTSGSDVPVWYTSATATAPIAAGNNTSSTTITANKTYYLAINDLSAKVGPATKTAFTGGGYNSYNGNYVNFTNNVPLTLDNVRLYIGNAGKITFTVANIISSNASTGAFTYSSISSTTIDVYATTPNPQSGSVTSNNPLDLGAVYYLNLPVPAIGNHAIIIQCLNGATIYRNNGISTNPYPYTIPGVISITGNGTTNTSDTTDLTYYQKFYYFLYDLSVKVNACASPRVAVVATNGVSPVITQNGNVFSSNSATGNQWYLNNVPIPNAISQTYTATAAGIYTTIVNKGCQSNAINYSTTPVIDVNGASIALVASPNPNNGQFFLQFDVKGKDDLIISLFNTFGQQVFTSKTPGFTGRFSQQLNTGQITAGMYILKIQHNKKIYVKKIMIE